MVKAEVFGLSGSGYGPTAKKNSLMNEIVHGTHHPVAVRDIFDCAGNMEGGNTNNSKFFLYCMKGMMDEIGARKELF